MDVPQLDFSTYPSQIFWLLLCVIFLFFFIKNVFIPRVLSILEIRERRIQGDRERALEARARAQQLRQEYEGKFLENQKEARHQAEAHLQSFKKIREERLAALQTTFAEHRAALETQSFLDTRVDQNFVSILLKKRMGKERER